MTDMQKEMMVRVATALTTLADTGGSPESMLYIGLCNMDIHAWETLRNVLINGGWIKISANYVTLTDSGKTIAARLNKAVN